MAGSAHALFDRNVATPGRGRAAVQALAAGALLATSFPPLGLPLAWIALWPLLGAVRGRSLTARVGLGTLAGMAWASATVCPWLYPAIRDHLNVSPLAAATLSVAAVWTYGGAYVTLFAGVQPWLPRPRWLSAPAVWVLLEHLRGHVLGGAPWALLGHSQHAVLPLAQLAELTGVAGLSFLVLMPAAALAESGTERTRGLGVAAVAIAVAFAFGILRLRELPAEMGTDADAMIQVVGGHNLDSEPLAHYVSATAAAPPAHLTLWPETAVPSYLQEDRAAEATVAGVARDRGWLLLGALRYEGRGTARRYFNSAVLLDPSGRPQGVYDKHWLVPFAESLPVSFLRTVERPFDPGAAPVAPLRTDRLRIGPLICWEAIFPEPALRYARDGVDVLVNLTSDRDLGSGALQQLAFSRFRAIETRRWLVRASGTGPAYLIDPAGRVRQDDRLHLRPGDVTRATFYVRHGELVVWSAPLLLVLLAWLSRWGHRARDGFSPPSQSGRR